MNGRWMMGKDYVVSMVALILLGIVGTFCIVALRNSLDTCRADLAECREPVTWSEVEDE